MPPAPRVVLLASLWGGCRQHNDLMQLVSCAGTRIILDGSGDPGSLRGCFFRGCGSHAKSVFTPIRTSCSAADREDRRFFSDAKALGMLCLSMSIPHFSQRFQSTEERRRTRG